MTNDEVQMNVQYPMTNYTSKPPGDSEVLEEAFWAGENNSSVAELHEESHPELESHREPFFDLEERTARFGEAIIRFAKKIPQNTVNNRLVSQLVGAGTSVGANYCEADDGVSKNDFRHKIGTCKKEARETKFFLRMVAISQPELKSEARILWQEAKELHLIFCAIWRKTGKTE